jgi:hypothetical protein
MQNPGAALERTSLNLKHGSRSHHVQSGMDEAVISEITLPPTDAPFAS